jgi:hypothetical protein
MALWMMRMKYKLTFVSVWAKQVNDPNILDGKFMNCRERS